jgi:hypothetical protein
VTVVDGLCGMEVWLWSFQVSARVKPTVCICHGEPPSSSLVRRRFLVPPEVILSTAFG